MRKRFYLFMSIKRKINGTAKLNQIKKELLNRKKILLNGVTFFLGNCYIQFCKCKIMAIINKARKAENISAKPKPNFYFIEMKYSQNIFVFINFCLIY